jgi:hypothetical protein
MTPNAPGLHQSEIQLNSYKSEKSGTEHAWLGRGTPALTMEADASAARNTKDDMVTDV